ncbi:MAG: pyridoxamine 5'-phosphate oxidase family protein [Chloroflexi bacterium]|nr:pyridoxamine 5'-phosphate oxidase family protein [Chloroflexota bacterium]
MTDRQPDTVTNLDRYGNAALPWSRAHEVLAVGALGAEIPVFLGTVGADGRPHAAGIGVVWFDGDLYLTSGSETRKSRDLAVRPACTLSIRLRGIDLVLEGEATRVADQPTLEQVASLFREGGWPAQVEGEALTAPYSAPSAGPPPWQLYRFVFQTVVGVASAEPYGATRWRFDR